MLYIDLTLESATEPIPHPIIHERKEPNLINIMHAIVLGEAKRNNIELLDKLDAMGYLNAITKLITITQENFDNILQEALRRLYAKEN